MCLAVQTTQGPPGEKEQRKEERKKAEEDPKGPEEHCWVMSKRKILNGGKKMIKFGGPKDRKARRAKKAMMASMRVVFALISPTKAQARIFPQDKGNGKDQKR